MAELLPSSDDDESLGDEIPVVLAAAPPPLPLIPLRRVRPASAPRASSPPPVDSVSDVVGMTSSPKSASEPEDEDLFTALFSPSQRTPPPSSSSRRTEVEDLNPFTPSPPKSTDTSFSSSQEDGTTKTRPHHKPVVSARDMLMKFLPKETTSSTALHPPSKRHAIGEHRPEARTTSTTGVSVQTEPSASERIARKYGLLPRRETEQRRVVDHHQPQQPTGKSSAIVETSPSSRPRKSPYDLGDVDTTQTYVSPFGKRAARNSDGFTNPRRARGPRRTVDKEAFYNDDETLGAALNRPRHVIASRLPDVIAADDSKDVGDEWFSDAKELDVDSEGDKATRKPKKSPANLQSEANGRPGIGRKRPRPAASTQNIHDDVDQWPLLPFPEANPGPFQLTCSSTGETLQICANLNRFLFDYQREGVVFLFDAFATATGAIVGDEMGLGKTIQVIALLSAILMKRGDHTDLDTWRHIRTSRRERLVDGSVLTADDPHRKPILVVVPASLLHNWDSELHTWMCCSTVIIHGKPEERGAVIDQVERGDFEIVICSYDILKITLHRLKQIPWEAVVLDEMHCLKNPDSKLTQAVKSIPCKKKLGLTGTLMQNNEKELHCLIDTIAPGVLGSWQEFRSYYGDDIKYGRKKSAAPEAVERSRKKEKELRQVLVPYYLRREKEVNPRFQDVKKCDQVVFCELTPYQLAAYKRILAMPEFELLRRGEEPCDCGRDSKRKRKECCYQTPAAIGGGRALLWERFHPGGTPCNSCPNCMGLVCVAQLLKLSNHMELLKVNPHETPEMQKYQEAFASAALGDDAEAVGGVHQVATFQEMREIGNSTCGKMLVLEKLLALWKRKRQKTLLFSRSTRMLDILQLFLISKAISYLRLDGNTKVDERLQLVNKFNNPESNISVFLISTRAGGLGLNLPTATNVVLFDPSWNPAHDCQAQDRAYRIGQTNDVQVYRLITLGTIEEMIYVRQIYKQQLSDTTLKGVKAPRYFEGVQGDRRQQGELFGIRNLLCWKEGGVLKDIQDAYQRDNDDLIIRQNHVQYDNRQASTPVKGNKSRSHEGLDEEMVDVADEITSDLLSPAKKEPQRDTEMREPPPNPERDDDHGETQDCLLQGARTLMHEAIVGDDDAHGAESISDDDDDETKDREGTTQATSVPPMNGTSKRMLQTTILPMPDATASPRTSATPLKPVTPTVTSPPAPKRRVYIPKYL